MAFKPQTFLKPSLMRWSNNRVSDHNRGDVGVSYERIEQSDRMANGRRRKYVVADKRTFSVSWENLPQAAKFTVDGFWGKNEMEAFYRSNPGSFDLKLTYGDGKEELIKVMFNSFSANISKRGAYDFWAVNVELEEA